MPRLQAAGLQSKVTAEISGNFIQFRVTDAAVTSFSVAVGGALGLLNEQNVRRASANHAQWDRRHVRPWISAER